MQLFGSTLATLSLGQLEAITKGDRDARGVAQTDFSNLLSGSHSGSQLLAQTSGQQGCPRFVV